MNREILLKYLNNNCSEKEFEELASWVKDNVYNKESKNWGFEQWQSLNADLDEKDKEKYGALLHKIHHEINLRTSKENSKVITLSNAAKWLNRVAAIFFIPLLFAVFYLLSNNNLKFDVQADLTVDSVEVIAPIGSRTVVQLSDGTEVNLNYGSRIKYPRTFTGDKREIKLTGEGYFEVTHNPDKPFVVKTGKLNVIALGTEFNVQAYPDEPVISTTLVNGKIAIEEVSTEKEITLIGAMVPGQHVEYNMETKKITDSKVLVDKYVAWKNGKMIFDNTPISKVAKQLSRKFNVDIIVEDDIKDLTYTVTFADDPLYLILDLMTETTPIDYKRYPRKKLPDDSFSKQEIRILKRN